MSVFRIDQTCCTFGQMLRILPVGQMNCAFDQMRILVKCALHLYFNRTCYTACNSRPSGTITDIFVICWTTDNTKPDFKKVFSGLPRFHVMNAQQGSGEVMVSIIA